MTKQESNLQVSQNTLEQADDMRYQSQGRIFSYQGLYSFALSVANDQALLCNKK